MSCGCGGRASYRCCTDKQLLTTVGVMRVSRRYYACRRCRAKFVPFDAWAGVGRRSLTEHARKLVTTVGSAWSFERASQKLWELCRVRISNDTVRAVCNEEGERARRWLNDSPQATAALEQARGEPEFYTDGVKVNTTGGWREMRLNIAAKREPTGPCEPKDWGRRVLNEPTARLATARIAKAELVGAGWAKLSRRLRLEEARRLSVIADGAKWIWSQAARRLPGHNADWCVDIYHVSQHLHDCGKSILGEGKHARQWADERLQYLLEHEGVGLIRRLAQERRMTCDPSHQRAIDRLLGYLRDNRDSLWYRRRLAQGLPIGSGQIEGGCKYVGSRLKLNGARWRLRRAERMAALRCLDYSDQTAPYWTPRAA